MLILFDFNCLFATGDSLYYLEVGRNIFNFAIHGEGNPVTASYYRPPIYSAFVGLIDTIFGYNLNAFFIIQSIISIWGAIITYFLLSEHSKHISFLSSLLIASSPFEALMNSRVFSENITTMFLLMSFLIMVFSQKKSRFIISGILMGFTILSRDVYLLLPIFTVMFFMIINKREKGLIIYLIAVIITISPWIIRNFQLSNGGLFLSKGILGPGLWIGTWEKNPDWMRNSKLLPDDVFIIGTNEDKKNEIRDRWEHRNQFDQYFKNLSFEKITSEPLDVIKTWIIRAPRLWFGTRSDHYAMRAVSGSHKYFFYKSVFFMLNAIIIITGILGIFASYKNDKRFFLLSIPIIYVFIIFLPLHVETRYSASVLPFIIIFSSYFIVKKWIIYRGNQSRPEGYN
ncbi:MAG: glycosyltransferase family 39 protein [Nitrospirae bacterium]|nr:glycosyltransferase family 39 protein [Nitrospirota bacterium]